MPTRFLLHAILLISTTIGVFLWLTSPMEPYTLQLVAILVLLYLGTHFIKSRRPTWFVRSTITLDLTILTAMMLLLITETGALTSPLFFLLYFLLFGVAMLYEIEATLVLTGTLIIYFLYLPNTNIANYLHLLELVGLVMVTPLAILFGHQYESSLEEKRLRQKLTRHLSNEESDTLLFLSLNLKRTLISALDTLSLTIPQTKVKDVRTNLEMLYSDLKQLYRSAGELQQSIDQETDTPT